jgi:hypothetical protein
LTFFNFISSTNNSGCSTIESFWCCSSLSQGSNLVRRLRWKHCLEETTKVFTICYPLKKILNHFIEITT